MGLEPIFAVSVCLDEAVFGSSQALATASRSDAAESLALSDWIGVPSSARSGAGDIASSDGNWLVAYHVPAPPPVSTVVPRKILAASPSFPAMALIPNPLPVRW